LSLKEKFTKEYSPKILKDLGLKNINSIPQLKKIVISVGIGSYMLKYKDYSDIVKNVTAITGQKPIVINSRIAISNFKLREGMPVGVKVTLRKKRMYDFFDKFVNIVCPRIRDFRGISPKIFDGRGNINIGLKDYTVFPEIIQEDITKPHGMQITIITTADTDESAKTLFKYFKFPFKK